MIRSVLVSPFQVNCWLLACPVTGETAIVDSGDDVPEIMSELDRMSQELAPKISKPLHVKFLLHTHAHLDHFGGTRDLFDALSARNSRPPIIALHPGDGSLWEELCSQGRMFGINYDSPLPVTQFLKDNEEIAIGELRLTVLHTPGHSPGGTCFYLQPNPRLNIKGTLFSGDTLFKGSIGRTDLWGGSIDTILKSIREKLWPLPDDTRICSGHGPDSLIGAEKRGNPFIPKA